MLKNVMSAGKTRQNPSKKSSLWVIKEHFEPNVKAGWPSVRMKIDLQFAR
jgi:hypothetical protein